MTFSWLVSILPGSFPTARNRILWSIFLVLFPLAFVGGVLLIRAEERSNQMASYVDRDGATAAAVRFAASQGIAAVDWNRYVTIETNDTLLSYYRVRHGRRIPAERGLLPARQVQVVLRAAGGKREVRVWLSLSGRVVQYEENESLDAPTSNKAESLTKEQEASMAQRAVAQSGLSDVFSLEGPGAVSENEGRPEVAWDVHPFDQPELTCHVVVGIHNGRVVSQKIKTSVDNEYASAHLQHAARYPSVFNGIFIFYLVLGAFYAIYRYARRSLQKEVSHLRSIVVAVVFSVSFGILSYSFAIDQIATKLSGVMFEKLTVIILSGSSIVYLCFGLLVGIAYGSGEGELREAYPGKLTSLDAALAGRLFAKNVGASILMGTAFAGWLLLFHSALSYFLTSDQMSSQSAVLTYTFARTPWLALVLGKQYDALLFAVAGLLVPASFLLRKRQKRRRPYVWLAAFALVSVLQAASRFPTLPTAVLAAFVLTAALLIPFFAFDLLAAIFSVAALQYVEALARLSAVFPSWHTPALYMMTLAVITIAVAFWVAVRGRAVDDEEVRPRYAKYLAERVALQAEVSAAREAQLRLLPQSLPEVNGLSFAACCLPARIVGGDFYDFFQLDASTVGIFVAEGGNQGLASALCIALAKGVLMHEVHQACSPTEILVEVENMLSDLLETGYGRATFGYAVFDIARGSVRYACTGASPKLLLYRGTGLPIPAAKLERTAVIPGRADSSKQVREGYSALAPGDQLIFYTGGVAAQMPWRFSRREPEWIGKLLENVDKLKGPLQQSLHAILSKYKSAEDLTAVVIRIGQVERRVEEGVA